ncbi:MAG: E2/UBC family protein [Sandaracinaceae bacterium]
MRRQFALPEFDVKYLDTTGIDWETIVEPRDSRWLLLSSWPVPAGYTAERVTVALLIPAGYPDSQIDMAYFDPHLARQDGKAIGALATHNLDGRTFQRWSRHRTKQAPWRPGEDDISSHLALVDDWLERELLK